MRKSLVAILLLCLLGMAVGQDQWMDMDADEASASREPIYSTSGQFMNIKPFHDSGVAPVEETTTPFFIETTTMPVETTTTEAPVIETTTVAPIIETTTLPVETTTVAPVIETTTVAPVIETTTVAPVIETTTLPVETTTVAPVIETTTLPVETTTLPVETTTVAPVIETTTVAPVIETTTLPVETTTVAPVIETTTPAPLEPIIETTTTTTEAPMETTTTTEAPMETTTTTTEAPMETTTTTEAPMETTTTTEAPMETTTTTTPAAVIESPEETTTTTTEAPMETTTTTEAPMETTTTPRPLATPSPMETTTTEAPMETTTTPRPLATPTTTLAPGQEEFLPQINEGSGINAGTVETLGSTIPSNGDLNPIGIAVIPESRGKLIKGNLLVSNFNNALNIQGTGTSIVQFSSSGSALPFATINATTLGSSCPGGVGLTSAITVLQQGWVIVGSLPTQDGTIATAKPGCLIVLNSDGRVVTTFYGNTINGPWGLAAADYGFKAFLFVSNVLNGDVAAVPSRPVNEGNIVRLELDIPASNNPSLVPRIISRRVIASGFGERADMRRLVIGPTGLTLTKDGSTLLVADSLYNRIAAIPDPVLRQEDAFAGLDVTANGLVRLPLGTALADDGSVLSTNGGDGLLVQTTPSGNQINAKALIPGTEASNALFGMTVVNGRDVYFVNRRDNTLGRVRF